MSQDLWAGRFKGARWGPGTAVPPLSAALNRNAWLRPQGLGRAALLWRLS